MDFYFKYIYTKLAYLVMKYVLLLVKSSKIGQMSKERETRETLNVPLSDVWNETKLSQKGRSDSIQKSYYGLISLNT